jgi:hypothetical protein
MAETQSQQTRVSLRGKIFLWLAWILGLSLAGFMVIVYFGSVTGEEFNPYTLEHRTFQYYQVPGLHIQVTPISRDSSGAGFSTVLINDKLVKTKTRKEWHLVWAAIANRHTQRGDASILTQYIGESDSSWAQWSKDNPKTAKKFWPVVFDLARRNHYLLIPDVMEVGARSSDAKPIEFANELDFSLAKQYVRAAKLQNAADNAKETAKLLGYARSYAKGNDELESLVSDYKDAAE